MSHYRKKPVVIEAVQWEGNNLSDIQDFYRRDSILIGDTICIQTLEGTMTANIGDWIIKGVKGEFYPCKPHIFAATYEPAAQPAAGEPVAHEKLYSRPILYTDSVQGVQVCRDDLWAVTTNEIHSIRSAPTAQDEDAARLNYLIASECQVWEVNLRYSIHAVTEHHPITAEYGTPREAIDTARQGKGEK